MNYTVSSNQPALVDGNYWYNPQTGLCYACIEGRWINCSLSQYLGGVDNKQGVESLKATDWEAKYTELLKEFDNFKKNTYADLLADLSDEIYDEIHANIQEQVRKDIRVEVYKEAREHYISQFSEANDKV